MANKICVTAALLFLSGLLTACQAGGPPPLSLAEAKKITANFSDTYTPPPRSIADVVKLTEKVDRIPDINNHCQNYGLLSDDEVRQRLYQMVPIGKGKFKRALQAREFAIKQIYLGNYRSAIKYIKWMVGQIPSKLKTGLAEHWAELASYYAHAGEFDNADSALSKALFYKINTSASRTTNASIWARMKGFVSTSQGAIAASKGDLISAEAHYRQAIENFKQVSFSMRWSDHQVFAEMALADVLVSQGRLLEAENIVRGFFDGGTSARSSGFALALMHFAEVLYEQGRYSDAQTIAGSAVITFIEACAATESLFLAKSRGLLAKTLAAQGRWNQAIGQYDTIRASFAGDPGTYQRLFAGNLTRAVALLRAGRGGEAEKALGVALKRAEDRLGSGHYKVAEIKGFLGAAALEQGRQEQAFELFGEAVPVLLAKGRDANDEDSTLKARNSRHGFVLGTYIGLLASTGERKVNGVPAAWEAFRLAEAGRSKANQDALAASGARAGLKDPGLADLVRREQDAGKQLATLYGSLSRELSQPPEEQNDKHRQNVKALIKQYRNARATLVSEIESRFPNYADLINPKPPTVEEARMQIRPGEALLTFYAGENKTYVWALPKSGDIAFAAVDIDREELSGRVAHLRQSLDPGFIARLEDIPAFDGEAAHDLFAKLLKPVESGWKGAKSLLVVADGALGQLPFSLLPTGPVNLADDKQLLFATYRQVPWLARAHSVTMLPSVASLKSLRGTLMADVERRSFLGFGDPFFNARQRRAALEEQSTVQLASRGLSLRSAPQTRAVDSAEIGRLPRLADTRDEITAIAEVLNADPGRDIYLGQRASEETVKSMDLSPYKVISFATHGLVPGDLNGLDQPALALSAPEVTEGKNDGLLTMGEILGLKLDADWAVLSACNTAAADGSGAEAVSGLGRAFFYAGARALLVSNWPVHSGATTYLMTDLFRRQAGNPSLTRTEALQKTRLEMIDKGILKGSGGEALFSYAHPIFWAPFTIVGDGGGAGAAIN